MQKVILLCDWCSFNWRARFTNYTWLHHLYLLYISIFNIYFTKIPCYTNFSYTDTRKWNIIKQCKYYTITYNYSDKDRKILMNKVDFTHKHLRKMQILSIMKDADSINKQFWLIQKWYYNDGEYRKQHWKFYFQDH